MQFNYIDLMEGAIRTSTPILFGVLGEMVNEKAGIVNLGIEGIMLAGGLAAVAVNLATGSVALSLCSAALCGAALGALHGFASTYKNVNQFSLGIAITIFCMGLTGFLGINYVGKTIVQPKIVAIPVLERIPVLGDLLFKQDAIFYLVVILGFLIHFLFKKTNMGLIIRSVGEDPVAAFKNGINARKVRLLSTIAGGAIMAIGGAYLTLIFSKGWVENITLGRGYIAAGFVIFAFWKPLNSYWAIFVYGLPIAIQLQIQANGINISPFILNIFPYIIIILFLFIASLYLRKNNASIPKSLGKNIT